VQPAGALPTVPAMARPDARHPDNVDGDWFADTRCIDCDVARHYAPELIGADRDGLSVVIRQPRSPEEEAAMWRAAVACPTQSIGTTTRKRPPADVFPWRLTGGVHLCGYNDESSFGAHSYVVQRPAGNVMVDAPRWSRRLVERLDDLGGVDHVLLSHRDDVADADRYAEHFGARVWIHHDDARAAPFATDLVEGLDPVDVDTGVRLIPTPGHTRGSVVYLVDDDLLFTGDTLHLDRHRQRLDVFAGATWFSWDELARSMARLAGQARFRWVLPGHGKWGSGDPDDLHRQLRHLAEDMVAVGRAAWSRRG
jgi:glyoxylase-like metal-dependent hydrolase (beta-lactamase superfamily II)